MKVMNVPSANYGVSKKNQPAFGMKISMQEEAIKLASKWFPKEKLEKIMPDILEMKTKNGCEIRVAVLKDSSSDTLQFYARAEGKDYCEAVISKWSSKSTFSNEPNMFDQLLPTLKGIKDKLDSELTNSTYSNSIEESAEYLKQMFGQ